MSSPVARAEVVDLLAYRERQRATVFVRRLAYLTGGNALEMLSLLTFYYARGYPERWEAYFRWRGREDPSVLRDDT